MSEAIEPRGAFFHADGDRFVATEHTRGPWSAEHQHGGPPSALLARAIEAAVADDPAFQIARLGVELMAPVPIATFAVASSVLRAGRKVRRIEATLSCEGRLLARATGLAVRADPVPFPAVAPDPHEVPPPPETGAPWGFPVFLTQHDRIGYGTAVDARCVRGGYGHNPTAVWIRSRVVLVAGEPTSPLQHVMIAADSGNGVAIVLDPSASPS